jgi:peptidyl-prolyl cis-trans isomerase C
MRTSRLPLILALFALALGGVGGCSKKKDGPPGQPARGKGSPPTAQPTPTLSPEERKIVLAEVNGTAITKGEFHDRIHRQSVFNRRRYSAIDQKKAFLDREFVMPALEYEEAKRMGLEKDPQVERTLKNLIVSKLMRQLRTEIKTAPPTDAELKAFYDKHQEDYNQAEMVRVSHVLVKTKEEAQKVLAEAKAQAAKPDFRKLVTQYSTDEATKARGGDIRYFDQQGKVKGVGSETVAEVEKAIVDAAWPLTKNGEVAGPVQTKAGWHVIAFTGRRPARKRDFDQSKQHVVKRVERDKWQEAKQKFLEKLQKEFGLVQPDAKELERRLELIKVDATPPPPGGMPEGHPQSPLDGQPDLPMQ